METTEMTPEDLIDSTIEKLEWEEFAPRIGGVKKILEEFANEYANHVLSQQKLKEKEVTTGYVCELDGEVVFIPSENMNGAADILDDHVVNDWQFKRHSSIRIVKNKEA